MKQVKVSGIMYNTYCGCDKKWDENKAFCYGDRGGACKICGYFPWAASKKSMLILSEAFITREGGQK